MAKTKGITHQLKEATQLTDAAWSVLVERDAGRWKLMQNFGVDTEIRQALQGWLTTPEVDAWLGGALSGGTQRSVSIPNQHGLMPGRVYALPLTAASAIVLVGAAVLDSNGQRIWQLAIDSLPAQARRAESAQAALVASSLLVPDLDSESPYDLPRALERALSAFTRLVAVQGAWIGIRRGDFINVGAYWNASGCDGLVLSMEGNRLLNRMSRTLMPIVIERGDQVWQEIPHKGLKPSTSIWICVPLVIGQRLIGAIVMWRASAIKSEEWNRLLDLAIQIAPALETLITFDEMAGHLRRLAMLNEFALTVSTGRNLDQIARRMFAILSRAFGTEMIVLDLFLNEEHAAIREYRMSEGTLVSMTRSPDEHPISSLLVSGKKARLDEIQGDHALPLYAGAKAGVYVPLRFRNRTIGMLSIENDSVHSFSVYDESLLMLVASHLASLADYTRVREEAEGRARNLGLIHEVIQQVVGLTSPTEIADRTASLLSRYFSYELTAVFIADEEGELNIGGFGGTSPNVVKRAMVSVEYPLSGGITGHVFNTGEGLLVNDVLSEDRYKPVRGWQAGSELCVPIRDMTRVIGIIDVESSVRNAFSQNDLLALESLAGILASVIGRADQYRTLQKTIVQLRETELELNERMEAQRLAEDRLIQAAKLAAAGRLTASIAHEINNPLQSVQNCLHLAGRDDIPDAQRREYFDLAQTELDRLMKTVQRMLDFYRPGVNKVEQVDPLELLEHVLSLTAQQLEERGIIMEKDFPNPLPRIHVVSSQIQQIFINLILNAIDALPEGGKLMIRGKPITNGIEIQFEDSGPGIPPELRNYIFEPFFSNKNGGTGLGLTVCYNIVTAHGGTLDVIHGTGSGACFQLVLPIGEAK